MAVSRVVVALCFLALSAFQVEAVDVDLSSLTGALNKLRTCNPETQLSLVADLSRVDKWWPPHIDPQACINVTLDIASFERVALRVFNLGLAVFNDSKIVGLDIFNCKSELPDVFNLLECAITQLENSGPLVTAILEDLKSIIGDLHVDVDVVIEDIKKCIGLGQQNIFGQMLHKIQHHC